MSKFFAAGSSSDSSSESGSESEGEAPPQVRRGGGKAPASGAPSAFLFSDDEDDARRVVRSAREKRHEQLNNIMKTIRNSRKIKDFNKMETSFQELQRAYEKARPAILKEEGGTTPR